MWVLVCMKYKHCCCAKMAARMTACMCAVCHYICIYMCSLYSNYICRPMFYCTALRVLYMNIWTFIPPNLKYMHFVLIYANYQHADSLNIYNIYINVKHTHRALIWCIAQYGRISLSYKKPSIYLGVKKFKNEWLIECYLGFELFSMLEFSGTFSMWWRRLWRNAYH